MTKRTPKRKSVTKSCGCVFKDIGVKPPKSRVMWVYKDWVESNDVPCFHVLKDAVDLYGKSNVVKVQITERSK